jgi:hypothetical protein
MTQIWPQTQSGAPMLHRNIEDSRRRVEVKALIINTN